MKKGIAVLFLVVVMCVAALLFTGCAKLSYGDAEILRIGDSKTRDLFAEHFAGEMTITVDANTGLHNYCLLDANSTYTRFSFGFSESEGKFPIEPLAAAIAQALKKAALAPE